MPAKDTPPPVTGLSLPLRLSALSRRGDHPVHLRPDGAARATLARDLGLLALRKLALRGTLTAEGREDWRFVGEMGATVVQPCVVTGEPVTTRLDAPVLRRYMARPPEPEGPEQEVPEDDSVEPLRALIDAGDILREALALALPDYPRSDQAGAEAPDGVIHSDSAKAGDPGDDRANPFAVLAALKPAPRNPDDAG